MYSSLTYFKLFLGKLNNGIVPLSKELSQLIETDLHSGDPAQEQRARDNLHYKSVIYSDISAKSTLKTYGSMFNKWKRYCVTANIPVKPPEPYTEVFEAHFDRFVLQTFQEMETKEYQSGRKLACTPKAFNSVFTGVNHIFDRVFHSPKMNTRGLQEAKKAYRRRNSRSLRKARTLKLYHFKNLCTYEEIAQTPWVTLIKNVIGVMFMGAGRWSCVNAMDIAKSIRHDKSPTLPANPGLSHSLFFWTNRKNDYALSCTPIPVLKDKRMDGRTCFLSIIGQFKRDTTPGAKLIPLCHKRTDRITRKVTWHVDPDPKKYMGYNMALEMMKEAMRLAGNGDPIPAGDGQPPQDFTLHGPRRGFVGLARLDNGKTPLLYEVVGYHGHWSPNSVPVMMGYNDIDPKRHAEIIRTLYETDESDETPLVAAAPKKQCTSSTRHCGWKYSSTLILSAEIISTDGGMVNIVANMRHHTVPKSSIVLLGGDHW